MGHMIILFNLLRKTRLFSIIAALFYDPINSIYKRQPNSPHPCQYLVLVVFLVITILVGMNGISLCL